MYKIFFMVSVFLQGNGKLIPNETNFLFAGNGNFSTDGMWMREFIKRC